MPTFPPEPVPKKPRHQIGLILATLLFLSLWGLWWVEQGRITPASGQDRLTEAHAVNMDFQLFLGSSAQSAGLGLEQISATVGQSPRGRHLTLSGLVRNLGARPLEKLALTLEFVDRFEQPVDVCHLDLWDKPIAAMEPGDPVSFFVELDLDPFTDHAQLVLGELTQVAFPIRPTSKAAVSPRSGRLGVFQDLAFDLRAVSPSSRDAHGSLISLSVTNHAPRRIKQAVVQLTALNARRQPCGRRTLTITAPHLPSLLTGDRRLLHTVMNHQEPIAAWNIELGSLVFHGDDDAE